MFQQKYTLRISLDDIVKNRDLEQVVQKMLEDVDKFQVKNFKQFFGIEI